MDIPLVILELPPMKHGAGSLAAHQPLGYFLCSDKETKTQPIDAENNTNDEQIEVVGTVSHVRLPHMRQHCTEHPFAYFNSSKEKLEKAGHNEKFCDKCYCYVCDVPVGECSQWANDHCHATDRGSTGRAWRLKRTCDTAKRNERKPSEASSFVAASRLVTRKLRGPSAASSERNQTLKTIPRKAARSFSKADNRRIPHT